MSASEADCSSMFDLFDLNKQGLIPKAQIFTVIRACGRKYLDSELVKETASMPDPVSKAAFLDFMRTPYNGPSPQALLTALRTFDPTDTGSLGAFDVIGLLTTLGEKMDPATAKRVIEDCPVDDDGNFSVEALKESLATRVPFISPNMDQLVASLPGV